MKKFCKNIIVIIIIFIASFFIIVYSGILMTKSSTFWKVDNFKNKLIIGDSHTAYALDDAILNNTINLSASADSYFYSFIKLKKITHENPQIDTIILAYSYHSFLKELDKKWLSNSLHIYSRYPKYFPLLTNEDISFLFKINKKALIIAHIDFVKTMTMLIIKGTIKENKFYNLGIGGYENINRDKLQQNIKRIEQETSINNQKEKSVYQQEYLLEISEYCIQNNLTLILLNTPIHSVLGKTYTDEKKYYKEFYNENLSMHKLLNHTMIELPEYCYGDCSHLNPKGAAIYSKIIKKSL